MVIAMTGFILLGLILFLCTSTATTSTSTFFGFLAGVGGDLEQGGNDRMEQMTEQEQLEHAIRMSEQEQIDQAKRLSLQNLFN